MLTVLDCRLFALHCVYSVGLLPLFFGLPPVCTSLCLQCWITASLFLIAACLVLHIIVFPVMVYQLLKSNMTCDFDLRTYVHRLITAVGSLGRTYVPKYVSTYMRR